MSATMQTPVQEWPGVSGKYLYFVHLLPFTCDQKHDGNYIFTKLVNNMWIPIYIGQGNLNIRCNDAQHLMCASTKGATHVHCHITHAEKDRIAEERDLLGRFPNAYTPEGCNRKLGG